MTEQHILGFGITGSMLIEALKHSMPEGKAVEIAAFIGMSPLSNPRNESYLLDLIEALIND